MELSPELEGLATRRGAMTGLPSAPCPQCHGIGRRLLPEAGERLREVRLAYGVSVRKMASALGVSQSTLCDMESGRRLVKVWIPPKWLQACEQYGRHLPPQERVEGCPEAPAEAPANSPLRHEVDEGPRKEPLARAQPRTISDEPAQGWALMREQREQKR